MIEANPEEAFGTGYPATSDATRVREEIERVQKAYADLKADFDEALDACEAQIGAEAHLPNANAAPPIREVLRKHGRLDDE